MLSYLDVFVVFAAEISKNYLKKWFSRQAKIIVLFS